MTDTTTTTTTTDTTTSEPPAPPAAAGTPPAATGAELMRWFVPNCPYAARAGIGIIAIEPGRALLTMPYGPDVTTIATTVHGGAIATLIDTAAAVAAWSDAGVSETPKGVTVALTLNYLAPAEGEDVEAHARVLRRGRRLTTVAVDARTPSGRHVAAALVTYQIG